MNLKQRVKNLHAEIKTHFVYEKKENIRWKIIPGNSKSLWNAAKTAKDLGTTNLPASMTIAGWSIGEHERSECFASFFSEKVDKITNETIVDPNVYNGIRRMTACDQMFMSSNEVESCIKSITIKNCDRFDRIPQRVLIEGEWY